MYLQPAHQKVAGDFINGMLWQDIKRCLLERRPEAADTSDPSHVAAAKGHVRNGFEKAIEQIEKLPFDAPVPAVDPMDIPAIKILED